MILLAAVVKVPASPILYAPAAPEAEFLVPLPASFRGSALLLDLIFLPLPRFPARLLQPPQLSHGILYSRLAESARHSFFLSISLLLICILFSTVWKARFKSDECGRSRRRTGYYTFFVVKK